MNTVNYQKLDKSVSDLTADVIYSIKDLFDSQNDKEIVKTCNTIRIWVKSGSITLRFDGGKPTSDNETILSGEHFIENADLSKIRIYALASSKIAVQIGIMV